MKYISLIFSFFMVINVYSQVENDTLPYYEIPAYASSFTAGTVAARLVDGLGFRFYWATDELSEDDLSYKPNTDSRTVAETIDHILDLSQIIINSTLKQPNSSIDKTGMTYQNKRALVLTNLKKAADILRESDDISQFKIIFGEREFPFWNQINGPIADAIWHCGQIASYRRTSGNPINSNVNHFSGTIKSKKP